MLKDAAAQGNSEKRTEPRRTKLQDYRIEIKFVGEPIYQFRVINVTAKGAGILIREDSAFLDLIEVGQIMDVNFISPKGSKPSGMYKAEIRRITKLDKK